jgi:hypothetical protein
MLDAPLNELRPGLRVRVAFVQGVFPGKTNRKVRTVSNAGMAPPSLTLSGVIAERVFVAGVEKCLVKFDAGDQYALPSS